VVTDEATVLRMFVKRTAKETGLVAAVVSSEEIRGPVPHLSVSSAQARGSAARYHATKCS